MLSGHRGSTHERNELSACHLSLLTIVRRSLDSRLLRPNTHRSTPADISPSERRPAGLEPPTSGRSLGHRGTGRARPSGGDPSAPERQRLAVDERPAGRTSNIELLIDPSRVARRFYGDLLVRQLDVGIVVVRRRRGRHPGARAVPARPGHP